MEWILAFFVGSLFGGNTTYIVKDKEAEKRRPLTEAERKLPMKNPMYYHQNPW